MKPLPLAVAVRAIAQLAARVSEMVRRLGRTGLPAVIARNGKPAAVLLSPEEFDRLRAQGWLEAAVGEGPAGAEGGRVVAGVEPGARLDAFGKLDT
jgi:prevent-host-death family protein